MFFSSSEFVSVKSHGAKGDGHADDTAAIQAVINKVS
jgi:glucan 1,3-beta-glucosidase